MDGHVSLYATYNRSGSRSLTKVTKTGTNDSARPNTAVTGYHGEADVGLLECGSVVGAVAGDRDHLAVVSQLAVNDTLHQSVLVLRRRPSQHSQPRPHRVKLGRVHLLQYNNTILKLLSVR